MVQGVPPVLGVIQQAHLSRSHVASSSRPRPSRLLSLFFIIVSSALFMYRYSLFTRPFASCKHQAAPSQVVNGRSYRRQPSSLLSFKGKIQRSLAQTVQTSAKMQTTETKNHLERQGNNLSPIDVVLLSQISALNNTTFLYQILADQDQKCRPPL